MQGGDCTFVPFLMGCLYVELAQLVTLGHYWQMRSPVHVLVLAGKELLSSLPASVAVMEVPHKHFTEMPSLTVGNYRTIYFSSYVGYRKKYYRTY